MEPFEQLELYKAKKGLFAGDEMMDFVDAFLDIIAEWVDLDHIPMEKIYRKLGI